MSLYISFENPLEEEYVFGCFEIPNKIYIYLKDHYDKSKNEGEIIEDLIITIEHEYLHYILSKYTDIPLDLQQEIIITMQLARLFPNIEMKWLFILGFSGEELDEIINFLKR